MERRVLGSTGIEVGRVALGTVKIGRKTTVRYPKPFNLPSDVAVEELLEAALGMGVNLFDTAPAYGASEARISSFVKRNRDHIVLCSKAGEKYDKGISTYDFSRAAIIKSVDESLQRLCIDRLDLLLLHSDGRDVRILEQTDAVETLRALKAKGKARAIGISARTADGIERSAGILDVVMAPFSKSLQDLAPALLAVHHLGLGVLAIKTLGSGHLAIGEDEAASASAVAVAGAGAVAGGSPAADAVRFVLRQPFVDALVLGTLSIEHLRVAVEAALDVQSSRP